jgi:hypothetical protein
MRNENVRIGQTYRVHIATHDRPAQHLTGDPQRRDTDLALFALSLSGVVDFDLTVTATDQHLGDEPAVTGIRISETAQVSVPLPAEVAERLGLPASVEYVVEGVLKDAVSGRRVSLPTEQVLTIPTRWLRSEVTSS